MISLLLLVAKIFLITITIQVNCETIYVARLDPSDERNNDEPLTFDAFVNRWHSVCSRAAEIQQKPFVNLNFVDCTELERLEHCLLLAQNDRRQKTKFIFGEHFHTHKARALLRTQN
jgi:hypothetical protein